MWQFAVLSVLPHFYEIISGYVVIYRGKDKNTTQGILAELVGSPEMFPVLIVRIVRKDSNEIIKCEL